MKTAVSLPDELFRKGEAASKRLRLSRSQLYATALEAFLERDEAAETTRRLNEVYAGKDSRLDPALHRAQVRSLKKASW